MSDAYHVFLESLIHMDTITKSEYVFALRRARNLGVLLEKYKSIILKLKNNELRNRLLEIYYSYSLSSSSSSLLSKSFSSFDEFASSPIKKSKEQL